MRRIAVAAMASHRRRPGLPLGQALTAAEPALVARALRCGGEIGLSEHRATLQEGRKAQDPRVCFWATWSTALRCYDRESLTSLQAVAERPGPHQEQAGQLAARRFDLPAVRVWHRSLIDNPTTQRLAVIVAGAHGDPALIPWLLEQMEGAASARAAGEAFSTITGVDIEREHLDRPKPEDFQSGPTEDPADDNVAMDPDDFLPWPDPLLLQKWWEKNQGRFIQGTRYLVGQPMSQRSLQHVLRSGYQRQRAAAALELTLLNPGSPLYEVRARGFRQTQELGLK